MLGKVYVDYITGEYIKVLRESVYNKNNNHVQVVKFSKNRYNFRLEFDNSYSSIDLDRFNEVSRLSDNVFEKRYFETGKSIGKDDVIGLVKKVPCIFIEVNRGSLKQKSVFLYKALEHGEEKIFNLTEEELPIYGYDEEGKLCSSYTNLDLSMKNYNTETIEGNVAVKVYSDNDEVEQFIILGREIPLTKKEIEILKENIKRKYEVGYSFNQKYLLEALIHNKFELERYHYCEQKVHRLNSIVKKEIDVKTISGVLNVTKYEYLNIDKTELQEVQESIKSAIYKSNKDNIDSAIEKYLQCKDVWYGGGGDWKVIMK